jgi:poly(A) polymerase
MIEMTSNDAAKRLIDTLSEDEPGGGLDRLAKGGFFHEFIPEIGRMYDMRDRGYKHPWPHTLQVTDQTRMDDSHLRAISEYAREAGLDENAVVDLEKLMLKISALMHDVGKTQAFTRGEKGISFPQHQYISAGMARNILIGLGFDPQAANSIARDCYVHHSISPDRIEGGEFERPVAGRRSPLTQIERLVADLSGDDPLEMTPRGTMDLQRRLSLIEADASTLVDWKRDYIARVRAEIEHAREIRHRERQAIQDDKPVLDGNDLMRIFGLPPGRWVGQALSLLTEDKRKHPDQNEERAIRLVREMLAS